MSDEFDELISAPAPKRNRGGRPTKAEVAAREAEAARSEDDFWTTPQMQAAMKAAASGNTLIDERVFHMPVSQNFLARVLNMDAMTVNRRLRRVKPVGYAGGEKQKRPLYDFKTALEHLLKPKMDIDTYMATLNPADMPNAINKTYWEAKRIKLKFEIEAGQAWATADVLEVLGRMAMTIKSHTQLWVENMRSMLSDEQAAKLSAATDVFNNELHGMLVDEPNKRQTRSRLAALELEMIGAEDEDEESDA
jgi:hypothetical protein